METFKFPHETEAEKDKPAEEKVEYEVEGAAEAEPEVEVIDDTPPEDRGRKPMKEPPADVTDEELEQYSESVKKRIQHFSKGYHEERRAKEAALREREEALRLAQSLVEENKKLQGSVGQNQQALLEQAKKVASSEIEDAKRKYKQAYEAGDSEALVAAQEELTAAKIKAEKINSFRPPVAKDSEPVVKPAQVPQEPAPVEVHPKARAWQQSNPWFGQNKKMTALALAVHQELVDSGVSTDSDEYYEQINAQVRQLFPDAFTSEKPAKKSSVVAPATRSTAPKKIVLTQTQVNLAKRLGVPLEAYARQVAEEMRKQNV